jgi:hypothetical protein
MNRPDFNRGDAVVNNINIWYVYSDANNAWMTEGSKAGPGWSRDWNNAKEFHSEEAAIAASQDNRYVVFGWVQ